MENASNSLLMAGSVLIGVMVLSLFVYLFSSMGSLTKDFQADMDYTSIQKFNEQFEKYIGRTDINTHEVLSIYNLVQTINKEQELTGGEKIAFEGISQKDLSDLTKFLSSEQKYICELELVKYSKETGKINFIKFKKNTVS